MLINNAVLTGSFTVNGVNYIANTPSTGSNTYVGTQTISGSTLITGSLGVTGSLSVSGSITATGTLTAQTLVVQTITSSIVYSSGSNIFGNLMTNVQQMTGSLRVTGSFVQTGANTTSSFGGAVGIGTTTISTWQGGPGTVVSQAGSNNTIYSLQTNQTNVDYGAIYEGYSTSTTAGSPALGSIVFARANTSTTALSSYTGFYTNNSGSVAEKMRITNSGLVGIGTTSPGTTLTVFSTATGTETNIQQYVSSSAIAISNANLVNGYSPGLVWYTSDSNPTKPFAGIYTSHTSTGSFMYFGTSNTYSTGITQRSLVLDPNGKVGIGSNSPSYTLDVSGSGRYTSALLNTLQLTNTGVAHGMTGWAPTDTVGSIGSYDAAGNLAIMGFSSAAGQSGLSLFGFIGVTDPTDNVPAILLNAGKKSGTGQAALGSLETTFQIANAGTAQMTILGSGNVGVGTAAPAEKLSVAGGISFSSYLLVGAAGYVGVGNQIQGGWTSNDILILNNNNGGKIAVNTTNGSAYNGLYLVSGATSWSPITSDIRTKKNFETTQGLAEVLQIEPVKYHLLTDENTSVKRLGFKAQNLLPLIPEMVITTGDKAPDGSDYLTIVPDYILPVLVKAIQEQQTLIQSLQERLTALENK